MALDYVEWCHQNGFDYEKQESRDAWHRYTDAEMRKPMPPIVTRPLSGRITRTWMQDREAELWRRGRRIIWPRHTLRTARL
jgi:hypothetical protein